METRVFSAFSRKFHSFPSFSRPCAPLITYPAPQGLPRGLCGGPVALVLGSCGLFDLRDGLFRRCRLFLFSVGLDPHVVQTWSVCAVFWKEDIIVRELRHGVRVTNKDSKEKARGAKSVEKKTLDDDDRGKKNSAYSSPLPPCAPRPARASR